MPPTIGKNQYCFRLIKRKAWPTELEEEEDEAYIHFVAVASGGTVQRVMTSPDGETWTPRTAANANNWFSVTYGTVNGVGRFVAVARDLGSTGNQRVMTSENGETWFPQDAANTNEWVSVTYRP